MLALRVDGLARGLYHYAAAAHALEPRRRGATASQVEAYLGGQWFFRPAAAVVFITAVVPRVLRALSPRGVVRLRAARGRPLLPDLLPRRHVAEARALLHGGAGQLPHRARPRRGRRDRGARLRGGSGHTAARRPPRPMAPPPARSSLSSAPVEARRGEGPPASPALRVSQREPGHPSRRGPGAALRAVPLRPRQSRPGPRRRRAAAAPARAGRARAPAGAAGVDRVQVGAARRGLAGHRRDGDVPDGGRQPRPPGPRRRSAAAGVRADGPPPRLPLRRAGGGGVGGGPARAGGGVRSAGGAGRTSARAGRASLGGRGARRPAWRCGLTPRGRQPAPARPTRFTIPLPAVDLLPAKAPAALALSPDGRLLAYTAGRGEKSQLYLRPLDRFEAAPVAGTAGAASPFFSPDGRWVGFFAEGRLKKVSVAGGPALDLGEASQPFGASWGDGGDDRVLPDVPERADGRARRRRHADAAHASRRGRGRDRAPVARSAAGRARGRVHDPHVGWTRPGSAGRRRPALRRAARPFGAGHVRPVRADRTSPLRRGPTASWPRRSTRARSA